MNQINPILILGKKFETVQNTLDHDGIEGVFEYLRDGEEQNYAVSAKDKTWEISLGKNNTIETIFLYLDCGCAGLFGITRAMSCQDIVNLMGEPSSSEEKRTVPILGDRGSWERYDLDNYSIHIEHNLNNSGVKTITLMLPDISS